MIGDAVSGLSCDMITDYVKYLGNLRCKNLGLAPIYEGHEKEPESMGWVSQFSNANMIKTDFFEAKSTAYAKSSALSMTCKIVVEKKKKIRTALGTQFLEKSYEKDVISNSIMNVASVIFITIIKIKMMQR